MQPDDTPARRRPLIGITTTPSTHMSVTLEVERPIDALDRSYADSVITAGGVPVLLPVIPPALAASVLEGIDGLVMSGGGDVNPQLYGQEPVPEVSGVDDRRDAFEVVLAREAIAAGMPTLFVCRGAQVLNVARGGTLIQHLGEQDDRPHVDPSTWQVGTHPTTVEAASLLARVIGATEIEVNSLHHQAVDEPGDGVRVVATNDAGVVEAFEIDGNESVLAVQWHPEMLQGDRVSEALFSWLVGEATARSGGEG